MRQTTSSPLTGKLFDVHGNRLTPTHSKNRHGRTCRYYVASKLQQGGSAATDLKRFPARRVDALIGAALGRISAGEPKLDLVARVMLSAHSIDFELPGRLLTNVRSNLAGGEHVSVDEDNPELIRWTMPTLLRPRGGRANVQPVESNAPNRDAVLISALRKAHRLVARDSAGLPVIHALPQSRYEARLMRLALLSPRIQRDIVAGRQPPMLRLEDIVMARIPSCWAAQERVIQRSQIGDGVL